ncbi:MAG: GntR family transcriptional regulator [Pseudomonadota bacterium]
MTLRFEPSQDTSRHSLPIYVQVSELLVREILAGRLIDGERLPPERVMAKTMGVAIGTLRKALGDLADKGYLRRIQGSGNYVRASGGGPHASLYAMFRLELPEGGGLPRARILEVGVRPKPEALPPFGAAATATRIRRLRSLNHVPVALEEIWLCSNQGDVDPARAADSLYDYYRRVLGFWITRAEDRVGVAPLPNWAPGALDKAPQTPVGFVERLSWADRRIPIEYSRTWFDPDQARYVQRMR